MSAKRAHSLGNCGVHEETKKRRLAPAPSAVSAVICVPSSPPAATSPAFRTSRRGAKRTLAAVDVDGGEAKRSCTRILLDQRDMDQMLARAVSAYKERVVALEHQLRQAEELRIRLIRAQAEKRDAAWLLQKRAAMACHCGA